MHPIVLSLMGLPVSVAVTKRATIRVGYIASDGQYLDAAFALGTIALCIFLVCELLYVYLLCASIYE